LSAPCEPEWLNAVYDDEYGLDMTEDDEDTAEIFSVMDNLSPPVVLEYAPSDDEIIIASDALAAKSAAPQLHFNMLDCL
jgi:hypothetical protein